MGHTLATDTRHPLCLHDAPLRRSAIVPATQGVIVQRAGKENASFCPPNCGKIVPGFEAPQGWLAGSNPESQSRLVRRNREFSSEHSRF